MEFNIPHIIVTAVLVFTVVFLIEHSGIVRDTSRVKRALVIGGVIFLTMLLLNLLWPYAPA